MSIEAIALSSGQSTSGYKSLNYGQGYGNYQNQYGAENKAMKNNGQFSMNQSANEAVDKNADMLDPTKQADNASKNKKVGDGECQTCKNRKYQDVSDDSGVSYQSPTKLGNGNVASAVMAHEQEHVSRNQAKAEREERKVVSQSVMLHSAVCPECGKSYVSGGTTRTVTKADNSNLDEKAKEAFFDPAAAADKVAANARGVGLSVDAIA